MTLRNAVRLTLLVTDREVRKPTCRTVSALPVEADPGRPQGKPGPQRKPGTPKEIGAQKGNRGRHREPATRARHIVIQRGNVWAQLASQTWPPRSLRSRAVWINLQVAEPPQAIHSGSDRTAARHQTRIPPDDSWSSVRCNVVIISTTSTPRPRPRTGAAPYLDARRHRVHSVHHCPASARGGGLRL